MFPAKYRIDIYNASGARLVEIWDYTRLTYTKKRNLPGELIFTASGKNTKLASLTENCLIKVMRKSPIAGSQWYVDFVGIFRGIERTITNVEEVTVYAPGILDLLNDRIVAYPPTTVNRSEFTSKPAETILHSLVKYNATASGTIADGRVRLATITGVSVATDQARGPTVAFWECAEKPLLDTMYELATKHKVAYQLVNTSALNFEWQYVVNTNVASTQIFSIQRGNVSRITYRKDRKAEKTVAIVGSTGDGTLKNYDIRTGTNYNVSTNNREMYVNISSDDIDEIYLEGDKELSVLEAKDEIEFDIRQTQSTRYGTDFDLHYQVTGRYNGTDYTLVVSEITVTVDSGNVENVTAVLENV